MTTYMKNSTEKRIMYAVIIVLMCANIYIVHRFNVARSAADYWHEQYMATPQYVSHTHTN